MRWSFLFGSAVMLCLPCCMRVDCDEPLECADEARILFVEAEELPEDDYDIRVEFEDWVVVAECDNTEGRWSCGEAEVGLVPDSLLTADDYEARIGESDDGDVAFTLAIEGNFHPLIEFEEPHFDVLVERDGETVMRDVVVVPFANVVEWCGCGDVEEGELSLAR